uniref:LacI family transcriptional regulator n=1 Tax=Fundidesulfovibrio putealis TaxID=270496 RepID=A0A7C4AHX3_9BACT
MPRDWLVLLSEEAGRTSIAAVARRLGYARPSISLALAGKYPGSTDKLAATVLAVLGTVDCPHLGFPVAPSRCADASGEMPTSSPGDLRLWRACQGCPHKPESKEVTR